MIGVRESGTGVAVPTTGSPYVGPLPAEDVRELRGLLARSLVAVGFAHRDVATILEASVRTVRRDMEEAPAMVDDSLPHDEPPGFHASAPRVPGPIEVTATLMARLRKEYGRGRVTEDGLALGELPEVVAWLESLEERRGDRR